MSTVHELEWPGPVRALAARVTAQQADPAQIEADALIIKSLQFLVKTTPPDGTEPHVAGVLARRHRYYAHLINPDLLSAEESIVAAKQLAPADMRFLPGIVSAANEKNDRGHLTRTLHIIHTLGKTNLAAQWVRRMTEHADCFVRSMAVNILCRLHGNPQLIEKQLGSKDARVRANAIESLWGARDCRRVLEHATKDSSHRVAVNALLGLYLAGIPETKDRMIAGANNDSPMFRAAIAWAMGYTRDEVFRPVLEQLSRDAEENVRKAAEAALGKYADGSIVSQVCADEIRRSRSHWKLGTRLWS